MRLLLLSLLLLSGCSDLVPVFDIHTTQITWLKAMPVNCGGKPAAGCADRSMGYERCTITMPRDAEDWVIAHEFKHCFGYEHQ